LTYGNAREQVPAAIQQILAINFIIHTLKPSIYIQIKIRKK